MPRSLETLLYDPDTPDVIREVAEMGRDATGFAARYIAGVEQVADACDDYFKLSELCTARQPFYVSCIALQIEKRRDRKQMAAWLRDVVDTLKILHGREILRTAMAKPEHRPTKVGMVGEWLP